MVSLLDDKAIMFVGIDGGGSTCRARLVDAQNSVLGSGLTGSANPLYGVEQTIDAMLSATRAALHEAGLTESDMRQVVVGAALAGLHRPKMLEAMSKWRHPFRQLYLTTDLQAACLGAHSAGDGGVVIVGTGSCGFASVNGKTITLGAHGFLLGDQSSGAWIGLEAIKAVLLASDGLGQETLLSQYFYREFNCEGLLLADRFTGASPRDYARLASLVFNAAKDNDIVANAIIARSVNYISKLIRRLQQAEPPRLSIMGGLSALIRARLPEEIQALLSPPLEDAEAGAIYFAHQQYYSSDKLPQHKKTIG